MSFIVLVSCLAHLKTCPIPGGFNGVYQVKDKHECISQAKTIISQLGYAAADFSISCKEKK